MSKHLIMPQLGESVTEGTIERWIKREGDSVALDEALVEVSTDKVTSEIPSPFAGKVVRILVPEGQTVPINTPIAEIELERDEEATPQATSQREEAAASSSYVRPVDSVREVARLGREEAAQLRSTPLVRRLAQEQGVPLQDIPGTGFGGRVRKDDLLAYLRQQRAVPEAEPLTSANTDAWTVIPLSPMRRAIAERLTRSRQQIPDATAVFEVDMTGIVRRRIAVRDEFRRRVGVDLTFLPFAIKAAVEALVQFPAVNVSVAPEGILAYRHIHIGVAVAVDGGRNPGTDGLVVPVLRHADRLSVAGIARSVADLAARARSGTLQPDELNGGTFTVNNTGAIGSIISTPIIPLPQAAIMTTEAIVKRPVVLTDSEGNDSIAIRSMMYTCLTFDHRAFDGLTAGRFMAYVKQWLESIGPVIDLY